LGCIGEEAKRIPREIIKKCADAGFLAAVCGCPWPKELIGDKIMAGIKPEEFDYFHELVMAEELGRMGTPGVGWGITAGLSIGCSPVIHFGSDYLRKTVAQPCLRGDKVICLAITEPEAGSDVANLQTTAVKTADGKHYIVNGSKKWITNGVFADFFSVAVRTGGEGHGGVSMLVVERGPGVTTTQMQCQGVWASGTTFITFEDVKVPVENLIGKENEGEEKIH
jgi:alkylation response protein AidB-like acyl-CoA dehydrogenase